MYLLCIYRDASVKFVYSCKKKKVIWVLWYNATLLFWKLYLITCNKDLGPYFNGLKRKWEAASASSFVGASMAMPQFYWRKKDSYARRKSKKGWSEVA